MKKYLLLIALLGVMFSNLSAQIIPFGHWRDIKVGVQPMKVVFDEANYEFHIFCAGLDANYNGVKDTGDVNPSWWVCEAFPIMTKYGMVDDQAHKVMDFEFGTWDFFAPFNPGILLKDGESQMYMRQGDRIRMYNLKTKILENDLVCTANSSAILIDNNKLYLSIREGESGKVQVFDLISNKFTYSFNAGKNVQKIMRYGKGLVILCEGDFGSNNSELVITDNDTVPTEFKRITLGNGANDFDINGTKCAVAMNGSHELILVSLAEGVIDKSFSVGTSGYNGPRNVRFTTSGLIALSTYNSDIRIYTIDGTELQVLETHGKAEGFDFQGNQYIVSCNQFTKDTYTPDSTVCVFAGPQSVEDELSINLKAFPNPSQDIVFIEGDLKMLEREKIEIRIFDILGQLIRTVPVNMNPTLKLGFRLSANEYGMTPGTYFLELISGNKKSIVKVNIY